MGVQTEVIKHTQYNQPTLDYEIFDVLIFRTQHGLDENDKIGHK